MARNYVISRGADNVWSQARHPVCPSSRESIHLFFCIYEFVPDLLVHLFFTYI